MINLTKKMTIAEELKNRIAKNRIEIEKRIAEHGYMEFYASK